MVWSPVIASYRFVVKSTAYTAINLIGLTAGLAASFILFLFTVNELSYNDFNEKSSRIYRAINTDINGTKGTITPYYLGPVMEKGLKPVITSARIVHLPYITGPAGIKTSGVFKEEFDFVCADQEILDILTIRMLRGDPKRCLSDSDAVIISETAALEYTGKTNPTGETLTVKTAGATFTLKITGVYKDLPWNSTLNMKVIGSMPFFIEILKNFYPDPEAEFRSMRDMTVETYILINKASDIQSLNASTPTFLRNEGIDPDSTKIVFQNISDIYLESEDIITEVHKRGNKASLYVYSSLALFILLLAGINYSMLSTARSSLRFKEIGMRKVLGASRGALRTQVLTESTFLTLLAFPISILLIGLLEPISEYLFGYQVRIYSRATLAVLPFFAAITLFIGLISGSYLSFYLSSLNPIKALRNQIVAYKKISLSKVFTVFQLLITIMLLISVITIYRQIRYSLSNELGLRKGNIMLLNIKSTNPLTYNLLKDKIGEIPNIRDVTGSSFVFPDFSMATKSMITQSTEEVAFEIYSIDTGFFKALDIEFILGKDFDATDSLNARRSIIINKEAVKAFGFKDPLNSQINDRKVIGVVSDVNFHSTHSRINPFIYEYRPEKLKTIIIKYDNIKDQEILSQVSLVWKQVFPEIPIDYRFIRQELNEMYTRERNFGKVVTGFTILAFIITGMGLFGLALLMSERKTKETAIRKVFGASNRSIIFGMQREFLWYIGVSSIMAIPSTWFIMNRWLANFYYKINLDWWVFVLAILSVTLFVSSILYFKTLGVLRQNPANALRYE